MTFLLGLAVWALFSGQGQWESLSAGGWICGSLTVAAFPIWSWWKKRRGSDPSLPFLTEIEPAVRIAKRTGAALPRASGGLFALLLLGTNLLPHAWKSWRSQVRLSPEKSAALENLRLQLAARQSWEPLRQFANHREEIRLLALLGLIAIRARSGEWHLRVTLTGSGKDWSAS